jgi:hypothetical protein
VFEGTSVIAFKMGILVGADGLVYPRGQEFQIEQILSGSRGRHLFSLTPSKREVNCGKGWRGVVQPEID